MPAPVTIPAIPNTWTPSNLPLDAYLEAGSASQPVGLGSARMLAAHAVPGWFNVKAYGAKGDGSTNDTAAINALLAAAPAGSVILIPDGVFYIATQLVWSNKKLTILGTGPGSILEGDNEILYGTTVDGSVIANLTIRNHTPRWTFDLLNSDGTFKTAAQVVATLTNGNDDNKFTYSVNFEALCPGLDAALTGPQKAQFVTTLRIDTSKHVTISRIFGRFAQVHLFRCDDSVVDGCDIYGGNVYGTIWIENGGTAGVGIDGDLGQRNTVTNNRLRYGGYSGVVLMRQHNALVMGNTCFRVGESGVKTYQNNITNSRRCYHCSIIANRCLETVYDGIDATADNGSPVERIDDYLLSQAGWYQLPTRHLVKGNYVKWGDILLDGYQTTIEGNSVVQSRTGAIKALGGTAQVITGNLVWQFNTFNISSGEHGILCAEGIVTNNTIVQDGATVYGFSISNIGGVSVGNYCKDTQKEPVLWVGGGLNYTTQKPNGFGRIDLKVGQAQSNRNLLTNGSFNIWQLGTSFTINGGWYLDGWYYGLFTANRTLLRGAFARDQTAVPGFPLYYLALGVPADGQGAGFLSNPIEGYGRLAGKVLTFSLWAKANRTLTGSDRPQIIFRRNINGSFANAPESYTLDVNGDWTKFTGTFQAPGQDATAVTTSDCGEFYIALGGATATPYDIEFALVQLEIGMTPSDFEVLPPAIELANAQRYVQVRSVNTLADVDLSPTMYKAATIAALGPNYSYQARLF